MDGRPNVERMGYRGRKLSTQYAHKWIGWPSETLPCLPLCPSDCDSLPAESTYTHSHTPTLISRPPKHAGTTQHPPIYCILPLPIAPWAPIHPPPCSPPSHTPPSSARHTRASNVPTVPGACRHARIHVVVQAIVCAHPCRLSALPLRPHHIHHARHRRRTRCPPPAFDDAFLAQRE